MYFRRALVLAACALPVVFSAQAAGAQPRVTVVATDSLASEPRSTLGTPIVVAPSGHGSGAFTFTLSARATSDVVVLYDVRGSADPSDITPLSGRATVQAGANSVTIPVVAVDDAVVERDEDVTITLRTSTGYTLGTATSASVVIVDTDQAITLTAPTKDISEPDGPALQVAVTRLGSLRGNELIRLTYTGTASHGLDYTAPDSVIIPDGQPSATLLVAPRGDVGIETGETIIISGRGVTTSGAPLTIPIVDARVTVAAPPPVAEVQGAVMSFVVTRTGHLASPATLTVSMLPSSATPGVDFEPLPSSITIPAGAPSATLSVVLKGDLIAEAAEDVQFLVRGPQTGQATATGVISANGTVPTAVTFAAPSMPFQTELTGTVTLLEAAVNGSQVVVQSGNSAVVTLSDAAGSLPFLSAQTLTIPAGATSIAFRARAASGTGSVSVPIQATSGSAMLGATLTVTGSVTHQIGIAATPTDPLIDNVSITSGASRQAAVRLSAPLTSTTFVQLTSTSSLVTVPASVTIPVGTPQMTFNVVASTVTTLQQALLIATRNGLADTLLVRVLPPVAVASLALPAQVGSGTSATGSITLNQAAPAGGVTVQLASNSPNLQLPASVTVPANELTATFTATVPAFGGPANQAVQVSATSGGSVATASVTLLPHTVFLTLPPGVRGGQPYAFDVGLSRPAPPGGLTVTLTSATSAFPLPASVTFNAGDSARTVNVATQGVLSNVAAVITAAFGASLAKNTVALGPAAISTFTMSPTSIRGGGVTVTGTVTLAGTAPPSGLQLEVTTLKPQFVSVPSVVTIPGNQGTVQFNVTSLPAVETGGDPESVPVHIRTPAGFNTQDCQSGSGCATASFFARPVLAGFSVAQPTVAAGGSVTATVSLYAPAPAGGQTLPIAVISGAGAVTVPAAVTVSASAMTASFPVTTLPGTAGQAVTLSVLNRTITVTITP